MNSNKYQSFETIKLTFFLISIAVFVKIFEKFYGYLLNGLKEHYKLQLSGSIITIFKWIVVIYLSLQNDIKINTLIEVLIFFSLLLIIIQRLFILSHFKRKQLSLNNLKKKK